MSAVESLRVAPPPGPVRADCGGLEHRFGDALVTLRCSGALWFPLTRTLVVADLHFEKGSAYAQRGQLLPPFDTRATLERLEAEVALTRPATLVFLGDSFHDGGGEARLHPHDAARLAALAEGRDLVWIVGNHDHEGPRVLPGHVVAEAVCEGVALRHEPTETAEPEVVGHLHPAARVTAVGRSVRARCFISDGARMVLPAFGAYTGGLNVLDPAFHGLFTRPPLIGALGRDKVHAIGWRSLLPD